MIPTANYCRELSSSLRNARDLSRNSHSSVPTRQSMISLRVIYSRSLYLVLRMAYLYLTALIRYLTVDYLLAELIQRSHSSDREAILRRAQGEYDKYLDTLDTYSLLSAGDKKLYEQFTSEPNSFHLASMTDAAARRHTKVARFREEKELKQKLEVWVNFISSPRYPTNLTVVPLSKPEPASK